MINTNYALSDTANGLVFKALNGWWLELDEDTARQMFSDSQIEICILYDDSESVIESEEELNTAIAENQMIVIFLGHEKEYE